MLLLMKRTTPPKLTVVDLKAALGEPGEHPGKPERINFLVSPAEKREIQETAKVFRLTVTAYLLRLHRLTRSMLDTQKRRGSKASRAGQGGNRGPN